MADVVWRERATRHLEELYTYLHERNPSAAERYAKGLRAACDNLGELPEKARRIGSRYRVLVHRNHLVIYRYDPRTEQVFIVAIIHAQRDVAPILKWLTD